MSADYANRRWKVLAKILSERLGKQSQMVFHLAVKSYIEIEKNVFCPKLADGKKSLSGDVYVLLTNVGRRKQVSVKVFFSFYEEFAHLESCV